MSPAGIPEAIRRSMRILATHRALFGRRAGAERTGRTMAEADICRVIEAFEFCHVRWALVGTYAIGLVTEPRATPDFDFIVETAGLASVVRRLRKEFGELGETDMGVEIQLKAIDVDLIGASNHPLFHAAVEQVRTVGDWKVPRTEVLIILKFMAARSVRRDRHRRAQDLGDLCCVYEVGRRDLDRTAMIELSRLVYPGAEREFGELLDKIDRGEPIAI
jgi:hypothetical protein